MLISPRLAAFAPCPLGIRDARRSVFAAVVLLRHLVGHSLWMEYGPIGECLELPPIFVFQRRRFASVWTFSTVNAWTCKNGGNGV